MELTAKFQDNLLLQDILKRNYFNFFNKDNDFNKKLNISFFYNNNYTNYKFIPNYINYEQEQTNLDTILKNWELLLDWYVFNEFNTTISIHDDILLNNLNFLEKILNIFNKKQINYKNFYIYINVDKINSIEELFLMFYKNQFPQAFIFNVKINEVQKILDYKLNEFGQINIIIPPGLTSEELINNQIIIDNNNFKINKYIEEDSDKWNEKNIEEYLKYIYYCLQNLDRIEDIFSTNKTIKLIDQHIIDNINCKKDCDFQNSLNILLQDLSINMCHKFQYDDQIIGNFIEDEEKILISQAKILPLITFNTHLKRSSTPHCETCPYINVCNGFCFAASYNKCFNPIIPIKESCNLKQIKFSFIFNYLSEIKDILSLIKKLNLSKIYKQYIINIINKIQEKKNKNVQ